MHNEATLGECLRALSDLREQQFAHSARVVNGRVPRWESQPERPHWDSLEDKEPRKTQ